MFDIIIRNGFVIDGTNNPWTKTDIGIKDGKIVQIKKNITKNELKSMRKIKLYALDL